MLRCGVSVLVYERHEGNFWLTGEDSHGVLAKYYGIPVISSRSAFYHSWRLEEPGELLRPAWEHSP